MTQRHKEAKYIAEKTELSEVQAILGDLSLMFGQSVFPREKN